jgi:hypothetical protein
LNIINSESQGIVAKTCGRQNGIKKITYCFVDNYYDLYKDKRDIILAEINACEKLLKYHSAIDEVILIEEEINELRMALDLVF